MGLKARTIRDPPWNVIVFVHPKKQTRKLRFQRAGRKGLHAKGGLWGESDWFEYVFPNAEEALGDLVDRIRDYLSSGFTIKSSRVYVAQYALALEQPLSKRARTTQKPTNEK